MIDILIIVILLVLSAFFSGSETAFTSLSSFQVDNLAGNGGYRGKILKKLYEKQNNQPMSGEQSAFMAELIEKTWEAEP